MNHQNYFYSSPVSRNKAKYKVKQGLMDNLYLQHFVHCGVCHKRAGKGDSLWLTSCAHLLCDTHLTPSKICSICGNKDISCIKLGEQKKPVPAEVQAYFEPVTTMVENVYNVAQFQVRGLTEQCEYYQKACITLKDKCGRQQQLLFKAKQELDNIPKLRQRIKELEDKLRYYKGEGIGRDRILPQTVDLTAERDDENNNNNDNNFMNKFKSNSGLKSSIKNIKTLSREPSFESSRNSMNSGTFAVAESTHLSRGTSISSEHSNFKNSPRNIIQTYSAMDKNVLGVTNDASVNSSSRIPEILNRLKLKRNHTVENTGSSQLTQRTFLISQREVKDIDANMVSRNGNSAKLLRRSNSQQLAGSKKRPQSNALLRSGSSNKFRRLK